MTGIAKSQMSGLAGEIDERIHAFLDRPLEGDLRYLWIIPLGQGAGGRAHRLGCRKNCRRPKH